MGLELPTLRSGTARSTDRAGQAPQRSMFLVGTEPTSFQLSRSRHVTLFNYKSKWRLSGETQECGEADGNWTAPLSSLPLLMSGTVWSVGVWLPLTVGWGGDRLTHTDCGGSDRSLLFTVLVVMQRSLWLCRVLDKNTFRTAVVLLVLDETFAGDHMPCVVWSFGGPRRADPLAPTLRPSSEQCRGCLLRNLLTQL